MQFYIPSDAAYHPEGCDCLMCSAEHRRVTGHLIGCACIQDGSQQCDCGAEKPPIDPRDEEEAVFDRAAAEQCPAYVDPDHEYGPHSNGGKA